MIWDDMQNFTSFEILVLLFVIWLSYKLVRWLEPYFFGAMNAKIDNVVADVHDTNDKLFSKLDGIDEKLTDYLVLLKVNEEKYSQLVRRVEVVEKELRKHKEGHK